jgi:hypothetical protein
MMSTAGETACRWCGDHHGIRCPWVKALEFDPVTGLTVTRVEFLVPNDYAPRPKAEEPQEEYERLGPK